MSYVARVLEEKVELREKVKSLLSGRELEIAEKDPHSKRPPRPCGITIHPGLGCVYECRYCYIYDMGFKSEVKPYPLTGLQLVYALLSNKYFIPGKRGTYLAIGSITEPFHPQLKSKTLEYIEAIYKHLGNPTQLSTKLYVDSKTAEKLAELSNKQVSPLVTVITLKFHRELEPRAPSPERRLEAIRNLRDAGLQPFLFLRPMIPGIVEREYREIVDLAVRYGAVGVVAGSLRVTRSILDNLRDVGVDINYIIKRLKTPVEKMKPGIQYSVYTSDIKREVLRYARQKGLVPYSSACMANLHAHGLKCWKMCITYFHGACDLEEPHFSEIQQIARSLGAECSRITFRAGELAVELKCKSCDYKLIGELLRSRYLACVQLLRI